MSISAPDRLDPTQQAAVRSLADALDREFGAPPLSDRARLHLGSTAVRHWLLTRSEAGHTDDALRGYAQLDGSSLEVATADDPTVLLDAVEGVDKDGAPFVVWSQGHRSPLEPAFRARGYRPVRVLRQLRRSLAGLAEPPAPDPSITLRPFRLGQDETAWLAVNAAAFAGHAEQGGMTRADLDAAEAQDWFDPAGFLLAERDGRLLGFHWTKRHNADLGEVYVLGVDPAAQGLRLGGVLLAAGLRHLADAGCREVLLYVDGDNDGAARLYEKDGFTETDRSIQWSSAGE